MVLFCWLLSRSFEYEDRWRGTNASTSVLPTICNPQLVIPQLDSSNIYCRHTVCVSAGSLAGAASRSLPKCHISAIHIRPFCATALVRYLFSLPTLDADGGRL